MNDIKQSNRKLWLSTLVYVLMLVLLLSVSVYAWFTITNENQANLISQISAVEAEYKYYVYRNEMHEGSMNQTLIDNVCQADEDLCYEYIPNPTQSHLIPGKVAPGERFSFAIEIYSIGLTEGKVKLDFGGIQSIGYSLEHQKIQQAFQYSVTKISYINDDIESIDQKDNQDIIYHTDYFKLSDQKEYALVKDVKIGLKDDDNSNVVIYFDLYFDPNIYSSDENGIPFTNSNIFMEQTLTIKHIYMSVYT